MDLEKVAISGEQLWNNGALVRPGGNHDISGGD
jgi:hypothetical protein